MLIGSIYKIFLQTHCVNWIHIQQGSIIILDQESLLSLRQNDAGDHLKWN